MKLTFNDPQEFEEFATAYVLGAMMLRGGGMLSADFDPKRLTKGAIAEAREIVAHAKGQDALADMHNLAVGARPAEAPGNDDPTPGAENDGIVHEHIDLPPADEPASEPEPQAEQEKPKRKRRTKVEIEAAEAAEHAALLAEGNIKPQFAHDAGELPAVMEHSPTEGQEKLPDVPKDAPKHQASAESIEKHAAVQAEYTPELIETLKGQAELFDANRTDHLKEGREAIAKHGYIKYMATFKGLGLDSAIATYNDEQVKLHRAAIAHLMAS